MSQDCTQHPSLSNQDNPFAAQRTSRSYWTRYARSVLRRSRSISFGCSSDMMAMREQAEQGGAEALREIALGRVVGTKQNRKQGETKPGEGTSCEGAGSQRSGRSERKGGADCTVCPARLGGLPPSGRQVRNVTRSGSMRARVPDVR